MSYLFKGKDGELSASKTMYILFCFVGMTKLAISGATIGDVVIDELDYSGLALLLGSVGAVYWGRNDKKQVNAK